MQPTVRSDQSNESYCVSESEIPKRGTSFGNKSLKIYLDGSNVLFLHDFSQIGSQGLDFCIEPFKLRNKINDKM